MARRWWRTGVVEMRYAASRAQFAREAARYVPGLTAADVEPELPLDLVTTRRYGSARITVFSR